MPSGKYTDTLKQPGLQPFLWTQFLGALNDNVHKMVVSLLAANLAVSTIAPLNSMLGPLAMYFWPVTMGLSAQHTKNINQDIERHFENMEFSGAMLQPGETASGFVYYRLPNSSEQLKNLTVEITVEGNGYEERRSNKMAYKFVFPTLGISRPVFSETSLESNGDR